MKLVLVGHGSQGQVGSCLRRAAPPLGISVTWLDDRWFFAGNMAHLPGHALTWLLARLVVPRVLYNLALLQQVRMVAPDTVLIVKGARVWPMTLRTIRRDLGGTLALYCPDDPYNPAASPPSVRAGLRYYHLIATSKRASMPQLERLGGPTIRYVPLGYDSALYYPAQPTAAERLRWGSDIVFVGAYDEDRRLALEHLSNAAQKAGWQLRIWGARWHHLPQQSPLAPLITRRILPPHLVRLAFSCSRIALGFVRHANRDTHAMRTFEIPATHSFLLAERTDEHVALLGEGQGAALFDTPAELVAQVGHYLDDPEGRSRIAAEGYRRITQGHHTYRDRLEAILAPAAMSATAAPAAP